MYRAFEEVREETKHEQSIEIAKSLLEVRKMTYEEIARSVQLPVEEVKALDPSCRHPRACTSSLRA